MALKSSGGYDYRFVDPPPKSLECSICLFIVHNPHVTSCCGNHFCRSCINPIQRDNKRCPLCNDPRFTTFLHKGVAREVNALTVYCPNKPQGCDWQGGIGQVDKHLNTEDQSREKGCGFVMVECKYKCGGRFQKRLVKKHETETCRKRPSGETSDMALLIEKLTADIQELKTESRKEIAALRGEVFALKSENRELKLQMQLRPLPPVPPFYFTIDNYEHLYKDIDNRFFSPPFYSHHGGYKLRFLIFPDGCNTGYNTHMSFYLHVMLGEYDDELQWPIRVRIPVEMYNCTFQNWTRIKWLNDIMCHRPAECVSSAQWPHGIHRFMPLHQLAEDYLDCDAIRFRVTTVQLAV